ncbi:nocturnin isoform X1 [Colossoma macropomum]|uniref:nocturnin isoform X1 n=2 Tax=Colossoma macropomum TaxID=42526 RepID=UPI001864D132|nr:nocturnin isoform X1 [Colossoma macropomum]XP_036424632.1 nocturnin isoform X1 [Colossoma macropomum]
MYPVRRCAPLLQRDLAAFCLSSLCSQPKSSGRVKRTPSPAPHRGHAGSVPPLTGQPQPRASSSSSAAQKAVPAYPMGSSSSSRLFSTLAQSLSSAPLAHAHVDPEECEFEQADPEALLRECEEVLRNRPPRPHRDFFRTRGSIPHNPQIRVMQWNILAQALGEGKDGFVRCPMDALNWAERKYLILEEILTYRPDILCLQEVDHYYDTFQPVLSRLGYQSTFCPKPCSPCLDVRDNNGPDGCALFFSRQRFQLLCTDHLRLSAMMLKTNQVAIVATLLDRVMGRTFCVAVTHLKARSGWEAFRSAQGSHLLQQLRTISSQQGVQPEGVPMVVCGDFNAEPCEEVYRRFLASPLGLDSAYRRLSTDGNTEPPYTSWKIRPSGESCATLDYIWYSRGGFSVDAVLSMPSEEQIGPDRLPSYHYPSDHLSLVCDLSFIQEPHRLM